MTTLAQVRIRLTTGGWINSLSIPHAAALFADPAVEVQIRTWLDSKWRPYREGHKHKPRTLYRARLRPPAP